MIVTYNIMIEKYKDYKAPKNKIARLVHDGVYTKVCRGVYETNKNTSGYLLSSVIYGPSYLSFDYALSYYGLIPETVYTYTNATFEKKKEKKYITDFGTFLYCDIPTKAYPLEIFLKEEDGYYYKIASPEKALCDKLYTLSPMRNKKEMNYLLFEDLRIDRDEFEKLNKNTLLKLIPLYHSTNLKILEKMVRNWHG